MGRKAKPNTRGRWALNRGAGRGSAYSSAPANHNLSHNHKKSRVPLNRKSREISSGSGSGRGSSTGTNSRGSSPSTSLYSSLSRSVTSFGDPDGNRGALNQQKLLRCCLDRWLERQGLLFGDSALELEYLSFGHYALATRVVAFIVCTMCAVMFGISAHLAHTSQSDSVCDYGSANMKECMTGAGIAMAVGVGVGSALIAATFFVKTPRVAIIIAQTAGWLLLASLVPFTNYTHCRAVYGGCMYGQAMQNTTLMLDDKSVRFECATATIGPQNIMECPAAGGEIDETGSCSAYSYVALLARLFGFDNSEAADSVMYMWASVQVRLFTLPAFCFFRLAGMQNLVFVAPKGKQGFE